MVHATEPRTRAYLELMALGLLAVREQARAGRVHVCEIEADHIHNIPSLVGEPNEQRHLHFIVNERDRFLRRLVEIADTEHLERRVSWCSEPWRVLADLAGVALTEWPPGTAVNEAMKHPYVLIQEFDETTWPDAPGRGIGPR